MALDPAPKRGRTSTISRERILEASLNEFAEHGYQGATTASVARRVGVTQPLIHYHFGSKEALWRAAVELGFSRMGSVLTSIESDMSEVGPREAIRTMARRFVHFNARHPEVGRLIIAESAVRGPRLEWMTEKHLRPLIQQVESMFRVGRDAGIVKPLPLHSIVFAFLGAVPHFFDAAPLIDLLWHIDPSDPVQVEAHVETIVEIFTTGLLVPETSAG